MSAVPTVGLTFVIVDGWPFRYTYTGDPDHPAEHELDPEYAYLPDDFKAKIGWLADNFENASCEAVNCTSVLVGTAVQKATRAAGQDAWASVPSGRVFPAPVGGCLAGEADELSIWKYTALVKVGDGPVTAVCEDCAPENIYRQEPT